MKKLIIVSDDFGFCDGVNRGCIEALQKGILTEMSFMVDSPGSISGAKMIQQEGIKNNVGLHITLNDLLGTGVYMRSDAYKKLLAEAPQKQLENRVKDEFKKFEDLFGRVPSHINGHQNVYLSSKLIEVVSEYALRNNIWVRRGTEFTNGSSAGDQNATQQYLDKNVKMTDYIFEHIKATYDEAKTDFINDLKSINEVESKTATTVEFFVHTAYVDDTLVKYSSLTYDRERDLELMKDPEFEQQILDLDFEITSFDRA